MKQTTSRRLSDRALSILVWVLKFKEYNDYSPSFGEIMWAVGVRSKSVVSQQIRHLKRLDLVDYISGQPRTLHLTEEGKRIARSNSKIIELSE